MIAGLLERAATVRFWSSSGAPEPMPAKLTVCVPESSLIVRSGKNARVGGSFTETTVNRKESLAVAPSASAIVTVIVLVPDWFNAGVRVAMRLVPLPEKTIFVAEIRPGLEEVAV